MADRDIVERLRARRTATKWARGLDTDYATSWEPDALCLEAADEIERLKRHAVVLANTEREVERNRWIAKVGATYTAAHAIFNDPPSETSQDVRDVIEWHLWSLRADICTEPPAIPTGDASELPDSAWPDDSWMEAKKCSD